MTGRKVQAKGRASREAGAVRQLAGKLKRDRGLEAKGLAQRTKVPCKKPQARQPVRPPSEFP